MANINCPLIGIWTGTKSNTLKFLTDGTINTDAGDNQYSYLVWEMNSDHKLVTLDNSGTVDAYDFTLSGSTLTLMGSGPLSDTYTGTPVPEPLDLDNILIDAWTAQVTGGMGAGKWALIYTPEGVVALRHLSMQHSFTCAYLVRVVGNTNYLVTYGQMCFSSPILATFTTPSGSPLTTTVTETGTPVVTWVYTEVDP